VDQSSVVDASVVFVPARPLTANGRKDVAFEIRQLESGEQAAIAFTSMARLVNALGNAQPWLAMPLGRLRELVGSRGIVQVAVDPVVPAKAWRWTADR
jgi:hypothetical protein